MNYEEAKFFHQYIITRQKPSNKERVDWLQANKDEYERIMRKFAGSEAATKIATIDTFMAEHKNQIIKLSSNESLNCGEQTLVVMSDEEFEYYTNEPVYTPILVANLNQLALGTVFYLLPF